MSKSKTISAQTGDSFPPRDPPVSVSEAIHVLSTDQMFSEWPAEMRQIKDEWLRLLFEAGKKKQEFHFTCQSLVSLGRCLHRCSLSFAPDMAYRLATILVSR